MICVKCDNDLAECTCADLEERFKKILACEHIAIGADYAARIVQNIERRKLEKK